MAIEEEREDASETSPTEVSTWEETAERLAAPGFPSDLAAASGALATDRLTASDAAGDGVVSSLGASNELIGRLALIDSVVRRVLLTTGVGAMVAAGKEDSGGDVVTEDAAGAETAAGVLDTTELAVEEFDPSEEELAADCVCAGWEDGSSANADSLSAVIRS